VRIPCHRVGSVPRKNNRVYSSGTSSIYLFVVSFAAGPLFLAGIRSVGPGKFPGMSDYKNRTFVRPTIDFIKSHLYSMETCSCLNGSMSKCSETKAKRRAMYSEMMKPMNA
jgi:hypothetical protein